MGFEVLNLNKSLRQALDDLGYIEPTPIQVQAFPVIMSGNDVVGIAQTGTGKTLAYILPLLRDWKFTDDRHPRILIVVPTRELVLQVAAEIEKMTAYMTVKIGVAYGGTNINTQRKELNTDLDIVVATPGRLLDLVLDRSIKVKQIKKLVIDEVDEMLNLGFRKQLDDLFQLLPERRQNLLFSATLSEEVAKIIDTYFELHQKIEIAKTGTPLEQIMQVGYHVPNFYTKINLLKHLLKKDETMEKVLVFIGTKKLADKLFESISPEFPEQIGIIHSNKSQNFRIRSVEDFKAGKIRILIATDIIARGLDISEVSHVINFDTPELPEDYIHRTGRTGRADKEGVAITFITEVEQEYQMRIEQMMKKLISLAELPHDLEIVDKLLPEEVERKGGDINYLVGPSLKDSKGAFHEKKDKNKKVNLGNVKYKEKIAADKKERRKLERRRRK
jgi:ATP-dependent RNA helicase RhlE